jgi:uncharacterized protein with GYD domain
MAVDWGSHQPGAWARSGVEQERSGSMPLYLYQLAYAPESIAAQMQNPQDRLEAAARPSVEAVGGKLVGGGFSFGEYDIVILYEAPDDVSAAAVALAVASGGAIKTQKTTKLLSGDEWVQALGKATTVGNSYRPAR